MYTDYIGIAPLKPTDHWYVWRIADLPTNKLITEKTGFIL